MQAAHPTDAQEAAISDRESERVDLIFKALASRQRREILALLASGAGAEDARCCEANEVCACVFSERLGLGAPTVSHHMKQLIKAGLVTAEKRGQWVYYQLDPDAFQELVAELKHLLVDCCEGCS